MTREELYQRFDNIAPDNYGCRNYPYVGRQVNIDGKIIYVTRLALERKLSRAIRPGYFALHTCDNSYCIEHLYEGTHRDNVLDGIERSPNFGIRFGEDHHSSKLTEEQVREIRRLHGIYCYRYIAELYGISGGLVGHIIHRRKWKHVE